MTLAVYTPSIFHPFINYDDVDYVTQNEHVQAGLSLETISWAFTSRDAANWHPFTWLSHALDCQLYGLDPRGHHLTSVLIHTANVVLLFLLLRRATGQAGASLMVAAVFALHPLNVESVAWVAERKNVLSTLLFLLALAAYGRYARQGSVGRYLAVASLLAVGLATKPMLVTLPFVLMLIDYWPLARIQGWAPPSAILAAPQARWPRLAVEKLPLLALSLGSSVITVAAQRAGNAVYSPEVIPLNLRLENAVYSYGTYIVKFFWPMNLALLYPHPRDTLSLLAVTSCATLLLTISILVWRFRSRYPYAIVGWLWFLGTLVPVIGLVQVGEQGMADRYAYLPSIGLLIVLVWGFKDWASSRLWISKNLKWVAAAVLLYFGIFSVRQIHYWRSSFDLWTHTLEITEGNVVAHDHLGGLLMERGEMQEALQHFQEAARLAPWDPTSHLALAANLQDLGDLQSSIRQYRVALGFKDPKLLALTYANLGTIYSQLGDKTAARENFQFALQTDPKTVHMMVQQLSAALQAQPQAPGYLKLGFLLMGAGQKPDAKIAFERALQLDPQLTPAREALRDSEAEP